MKNNYMLIVFLIFICFLIYNKSIIEPFEEKSKDECENAEGIWFNDKCITKNGKKLMIKSYEIIDSYQEMPPIDSRISKNFNLIATTNKHLLHGLKLKEKIDIDIYDTFRKTQININGQEVPTEPIKTITVDAKPSLLYNENGLKKNTNDYVIYLNTNIFPKYPTPKVKPYYLTFKQHTEIDDLKLKTTMWRKLLVINVDKIDGPSYIQQSNGKYYTVEKVDGKNKITIKVKNNFPTAKGNVNYIFEKIDENSNSNPDDKNLMSIARIDANGNGIFEDILDDGKIVQYSVYSLATLEGASYESVSDWTDKLTVSV